MKKKSAGLLIYRFREDKPEVFLVHPGGPFWKNKDAGAWSLPKGEYDDEEDALETAIREVEEETGFRAEGNLIELTAIVQKGGKAVCAWAVEGNPDPSKLVSNTFEIEWPPSSGKKKLFPEVDRAAWFPPEEAVEKIIPAQGAFIRELLTLLGR
jgi:predicted NUDIX family NTP pyrophosphohydrolase